MASSDIDEALAYVFVWHGSMNEAAQRVFTLPLKLYSQSSLGESMWDRKAWFGKA